MRITVDRKYFIDELQVVARAIASQTTIPILGNVRLDVTDGLLLMAGTDCQVTIETSCPADVEEDGGVTIDAKALLDAVKSSESESIGIETDSGKATATIFAGSAKFNLPCLDIKDFPTIMPLTDADEYAIDTDSLRNALSEVAYAMDDVETKFTLNGIFVTVRKEGAELVAMSGDYQLGLVRLPEPSAAKERKLFLPSKLVSAWLKHAESEQTTILWDDPRVQLVTGRRKVQHVGYAINFPTYREGTEQCITRATNTALVDTQRLSALLTRVLRFAGRSACISVDMESGKMRASGQDDWIGSASDHIAIDYPGPTVSFALNATRLLRAVKAIRTPMATLHFAEGTPLVIRPDDDSGSVHLLGLMRK